MIQLIKEGKVKKAKKDHECMASLFFREGLGCYGPKVFSFAEMREIIRMKRNRWKIKAGDSYIWQFNRYDNDAYLFKANPTIHAICCRLDLYPED